MDDANDNVDDSFTMDDLTGWGDSDCDPYYDDSQAWWGRSSPVKSPVKSPATKTSVPKLKKSKDTVDIQRMKTESLPKDTTRRLSVSQSLGVLSTNGIPSTSTLLMPFANLAVADGSSVMAFKTAAFSPSAGTVLEPVNMLHLGKDANSPLAKPFSIYKYNTHKLHGHRRQHQAAVKFHLVTSSAEAEMMDSRPSSDDHLPPLTSPIEDAASSTKSRERFIQQDSRDIRGRRNQQSAWHRPQANPSKITTTSRTTRDRGHQNLRLFSRGETPHKTMTTTKQLCKNDKPTVADCQRRFSLVTTQMPDTVDSSYLSNALLYAPRRRSLSNASQPSVEEDVEDAGSDHQPSGYEATALSISAAITQTLVRFAVPPPPA